MRTSILNFSPLLHAVAAEEGAADGALQRAFHYLSAYNAAKLIIFTSHQLPDCQLARSPPKSCFLAQFCCDQILHVGNLGIF